MPTETSFPAREFNAFLQIDAAGLDLVRRYQAALMRGAESFAGIFYDYLFKFEEPSRLLSQYQQDGGNIEQLARKQVDHLLSLISQLDDPSYPERLRHIGQIHYQRQIDPAWIMGAYRLYQEHIYATIQHSTEIEDADRGKLNDTLNKLLFRDMGMMLEGYWITAASTIEAEKGKVEELQQQISDLLRNIPQIIWSIDVIHNRPLYISPTVEEISPISMELPIPCLAWTVPEDRLRVEAAWAQALTGEQVAVESRVIGPKRQLHWFKRTFHPFLDTDGKVVRIDGIMEEITEAKLAHSRLQRMASTDELTGLANRALWYDRLAQTVTLSHRHAHEQIAVMLFDLNHFKCINDTLGHPVGDLVLRQVARRLQGLLREGDTLARLGGDEFALLLPRVEDGRLAAKVVAQKVHECFEAPFHHDGNQLYLGIAIGVAVYPLDGDDPDTLVRRADAAMYLSKRHDIPCQFYETGLEAASSQQVHLVSEMKRALSNEEFVLHFQPKIDLRSGQTSGLEALIRWTHPEHGTLFPDSFIPIAEQMGMMPNITEWVLAEALRQSQRLRQLGIIAPIAVNVSARSFQNREFLALIQSALAKAEAAPECLELEITENTLMSNLGRGAEMLKSLSDLGVVIAIDDFGTGYSSLSYLKRLPIHQLKIDKSFIQEMDTNENDAAIVRSVIELGHNLGIQVVAEGVERAESLDMLKDLGCDAAQGYHISRPMPVDSIPPWFNHMRPH